MIRALRAATFPPPILASRSPSEAESCPRLRVLAGVRGDGFNGIETYAEQLAVAASAAGHDVTLVTTSASVAKAVRARQGAALTVLDAGMREPHRLEVLGERLSPQFQSMRLGRALARTLAKLPPFDVVHLNRPALAPWVPATQGRIFVAGWFYPHAARARLAETWHHAPGRLPRRLALTLKSLAFYAGDARGYRAPSQIVACTETLAAQLRAQGHQAFACPPPVQELPPLSHESLADPRVELRLLVCSGDLSHPRKNLRDAVRAAAKLAERGHNVLLQAIGQKPEALQSAARELPARARLELLGPKTPQDVREAMRRAHVFVLPSLYEEWGYVAVEAILSGTPVVTYPVYPFKDMLAGGLGVVAAHTTPTALAQAIEHSLGGMRGPALCEAGKARYGAAAVGQRLTQIWIGREAPQPRAVRL